MAQYIDKAAVTAEIDNMLNTEEHTSHLDEIAFNSGRWKALKKVKDIIDTIPVKEVETSSDKKQLKLKEDCHTCTYNLYGLYPCAAVNKQGAIDYLEGKTDGCSEWYDEW